MKLFNRESLKKSNYQEKPLTDKKIEKENIPINEESGDIIKDRPGLKPIQQDQTIIKEHLYLNKKGFEGTPSKEKEPIELENIPEDFDWVTFILNKIDNPDSESEEINEIKVPAGVHRPQFVNNIIQKYSLPANEWQALSHQQRTEIKQSIQKEIQELYIKKPKKMVRKDKTEKELAA